MVRTITVTETVTRLAIDAPTSTPSGYTYPLYPEHEGFGPTLDQVALPAFLSTLKFLLTLASIFIATTFVTFLILKTRTQILRTYHNTPRPPSPTDPEQEMSTALSAARCVALSHALTVLILVLRTRQALGSLAPIAYEVFTLMLGVEAAVVVVVGMAFGVVKGMEWWEEERRKAGAGGGEGKKAE